MEEFFEKEARDQYRMLGHAEFGVTEIFALCTHNGKSPLVGFFDNEEDCIRAFRELNGEFNIYVGVNPRPDYLFNLAPNQMESNTRRARTEDIKVITGMFLDIDPFDKKRPTDDATHQAAIDKAKEIIGSYPFLQDSSILSSGNGAQILARVEFAQDPAETAKKIKALSDNIRKTHFSGDSDMKLDTVHDLPRVMAAAGTLKMKGEATDDRPYRLVQFLSEAVLNVNHALMEEIEKQEVKKNPPPSQIELDPEGGEEPYFDACPCLKSILEGRGDIYDRSEFCLSVAAVFEKQGWAKAAFGDVQVKESQGGRVKRSHPWPNNSA